VLSPGAGVVTSRGLVRYVVTEYSVAYLHGKSIRERAKALIEIAHPKFREELYEYCEQTKWLQRPRAGPCRLSRVPQHKDLARARLSEPNVLDCDYNHSNAYPLSREFAT